MTNNLVLSQNDSQEEFISKLRQFTNYQERVRFPLIKFNAKEGKWFRETGETDGEGKPIYEELGESVRFHLITTRNLVQTNMDAPEQLYSREFQENYLVLYNQNKQEVMRGYYNVLKLANPNLQYNKVLYVYHNDKPYKIKIGGIKLSKWFTYFASFKNDSPARYYTLAERGDLIKTSLKNGQQVKNYDISFSCQDEIEDKQLIIKRVNDINEYLALFNQSRPNNNLPQIEEPPMPEGAPAPEEVNFNE